MNSSLTVVLPLRNVESSLPSVVAELLEILPELTSRFEVVMVDDGSTDHTIDVAHEQSLLYPQVQLLVHPTKLGAQECLRSALRYSQGEVLLLCRDVAEFDPNELLKLSGGLTAESAVAGRYERSGGIGTIPQPPKRFQYAKASSQTGDLDAGLPDLLLVPRRLLLGWQQSGDRQNVVANLQARGFALPTVAVRGRRSRKPSLATSAVGIARGLQARPSGATARRAENSRGAENRGIENRSAAQRTELAKIDPPAGAPPRGPSYLISRLRSFTWGE